MKNYKVIPGILWNFQHVYPRPSVIPKSGYLRSSGDLETLITQLSRGVSVSQNTEGTEFRANLLASSEDLRKPGRVAWKMAMTFLHEDSFP